jgi:hypothetical protein
LLIREAVVLGIAHGRAGVEQQVGAQVGLDLVLFDDEAIGFGVNPPVDMPQVVTGDVLAAIGELDAEALVGALMQSAQKAFDHVLGAQLEAAQLVEHVRMKVAGCIRHRGKPPFRAGQPV